VRLILAALFLEDTRLLRRLAPDLAVFLLALLARVAFLWLVNEPLAYPYHFKRALQIAQHPDPVGFVLRSDDWRSWGTDGSGGWTLAPLYYLFAAGVVALFGPNVRTLQVVHGLLEALTAVGVGRLGRLLAGPLGTLAGVAYALSWHAVVFHAGVDQENLHTVLLVWGVTLLAGAAGVGPAVGGGFLLGLSALVRPVALAFLPLAALWQWRSLGGLRGARRAGLVLAAGALAVAPWLLRNRMLYGEFVPIETVSVFNLWNDNAFVDEGRWGRQARLIEKQRSFAGKEAEAVRFAWRGWTRDPQAGLAKIVDGLDYFLGPTDTHTIVSGRSPRPVWQQTLALVFGDGVFALAIVLAAAFVAAGARTPQRSLVLLWLAYYTFMLVIVFHSQVRYRTGFNPFLLACAAGAVPCSRETPEGKRRLAFGALVGLALVVWASSGELAALGRAFAAR
jgi:hypothetical protein